jgi:SAM-dependent methyltransferase
MILYCLDCDFYHLHRGSSPDDILDSYRREYLDGMYLRIAEWCRTSEGTEDGLYGLYYKTLKWLEADPRVEFRNLAGGKALDIGCAVGAMMTILRRRGWETWGIEPSRQLAELAQQQGHQVLVGFLEDQELEMESFDLVTLMHVLEHVPQPGHLMKEVGRITRPGGHLLLSLPVIKCLQHFTTGSGYFHQPHHLSFFSPANIARLLEESGFKIIAFETPEDVVHRFEHLRRGELPWHPLLVTRMERWRLGAFLDVYAEKI